MRLRSIGELRLQLRCGYDRLQLRCGYDRLQLRCGCGAGAIDPRTQAAAAVRVQSIRELSLQLRCGCGAAVLNPRTQVAIDLQTKASIDRKPVSYTHLTLPTILRV